MTPLEWAGLFVGAFYLACLAMWISMTGRYRAAQHELVVDELWDDDGDLAVSA